MNESDQIDGAMIDRETKLRHGNWQPVIPTLGCICGAWLVCFLLTESLGIPDGVSKTRATFGVIAVVGLIAWMVERNLDKKRSETYNMLLGQEVARVEHLRKKSEA